jgi:hypothetical protein
MSDFVPEGKTDHFPNLYSDSTEIISVAEWSDERHNYKTAEYRAFMRREDLMPRAKNVGQFILTRLEFEGDCRDGIYDVCDSVPEEWSQCAPQ